MASDYRDKREESRLVRWYILDILQAAMNLDRGNDESPRSYVDEGLLYEKVGRRFPQLRGEFWGQLNWLRDKGYVKLREVKIGSRKYLQWRILAAGTDVLDGTAEDPGVGNV